MPSPIIARADALMHRRRQSDNDLDDVPVLTDSIDEFHDIPVLTEIEATPENAMRENNFPPKTDPAIAEPLAESQPEALTNEALTDDRSERDRLINELASRIESRIKAALPEIIGSTIREFMAEQEMIENS